MSSIKIKNYNQLELKSVRLVLERTPYVEYFCTSANIPGISGSPALVHSPFTPIKVHGDKLTFQPLIATFVVDEDLKNWQEIFDWMVSYAHPTTFEEYKDDTVTQHNLVASKRSQANLLIPNNKYNSAHEFAFYDVIPIDLSDILVDVQIDDVQASLCTVTFDYTTYERIK